MKTISNYSSKATITSLLLILISMFFTSVFGQDTKKDKTMSSENEWWIPILVKHNMEMKGSNTFKNIFEMGSTNSVENVVCTLTNAFVILRDKSENYSVIESPLLIHDFIREPIIANEGIMKVYKKDSETTDPIVIIKIQKMELKFPRN
jgi:hypothetical protein